MLEIVRYFVVFAPVGLLVGLALLLVGQLYRMSQLESLFTWLESEGHTLSHHDFARSLWARTRLCRSALAALCVSGATLAVATLSAALLDVVPTLGALPTLVLLTVAMVAIVFAMVLMILDAKVEYGMFRARYEFLTGRDASQDSRWA